MALEIENLHAPRRRDVRGGEALPGTWLSEDRGREDKKARRVLQGPTLARSINLCICGSSMTTPTARTLAAVYGKKDFVEGFASKFRPLLMTQR